VVEENGIAHQQLEIDLHQPGRVKVEVVLMDEVVEEVMMILNLEDDLDQEEIFHHLVDEVVVTMNLDDDILDLEVLLPVVFLILPALDCLFKMILIGIFLNLRINLILGLIFIMLKICLKIDD